jgi:Hypothetical glycosyl hydrolase family 15
MVFSSSHRQHLQYWLTGLVLLLALSGCIRTPSSRDRFIVNPTSALNPTPTPALPFRPFIDTWQNIHLFLAFDYHVSNPAAVANRYDFVWGARIDHVANFRAGNPDIFLSYYIPFQDDWGTFTNNSATHDLAYWKATHPDWILYKCDRTTPADQPDHTNVPFDFADPAVVSWQVQTYAQQASTSGYNAIAADNLDLENYSGACGAYKNGKWVQLYTGQPNDPQWRADIITWVTRMQYALHHLKHPLALIVNLGLGKLSPNNPQVRQVLNNVDGISDESGFTDYGFGYLTDNSWFQKIQWIESMQEQSKLVYIVNQFPSVNRAEIQWALASYLMCKEHAAALFISTIQGYGGDSWYSEYNAQIGAPLGSMYQAQNVYFRNYSHGLSIVNPSATNTYRVILSSKSSYKDMYGNAVGQALTLPPHTGLVLLIAS